MIVFAGLTVPAFAQQKTNSLDFKVADFEVQPERFALRGRGLVKLVRADLKDKIVAVRLHYTVRLKSDAFTSSSTTWATITNGVGLVEIYASVPEPIATAVRERSDYVILKWEVLGWYFMNPGTISD